MTLHRPTYCGLLLGVVALTCVAGGLDVGAQSRRRPAPLPPPATLLLPAETAWSAVLPAAPVAPGVVVGGAVVVALTSGTLYAVDWSTGEFRWTQPHPSSLPPVASGTLVVAATPTSLDAFAVEHGDARWSLPLAAPPVALAGTSLIAYVLDSRTVTAVDPSTGRVRWAQPMDSPPTTATVGASSAAVTLSDGRVIAFSNADGRRMWVRALEGTLTEAAWSGGVLAVGSSARAAWGLDARDGGVKWQWPLGGSVGGVAADTERVFVATRDNLLRALNRGNGHQRWQQDIGTRAQYAPVAFDGAVLVVGLTPTLTLYDSKTGTSLGTYDAPGKVLGPPLVDRSLRPGGVSMVLVLRDGRMIGLRSTGLSFLEQPPTPLPGLPGRTMPRERLPETGR